MGAAARQPVRETCTGLVSQRPPLVIVGAFPARPDPGISGGVLISCQALLRAGIGDNFDLRLVDTTQKALSTPSILRRLLSALLRSGRFLNAVVARPRPCGALIFMSEGFSFLEKCLLARIACVLGLTVVIAPRGGGIRAEIANSRVMRIVATSTIRRVDHVICQGDSWVRYFEDLLGPAATAAAPMKLVSLMNWTASDDCLRVGRERLAAEPEVRNEGLSVLFFGQLLRQKGIIEMIEGFALARATAQREGLASEGFRLVVAGLGPLEAEARAMAATLGVAPAVSFPGWLEGPAKLEALRDADCLCLPSWSEGLPNALVEAMAAGLPTIMTPVGGIPDAAPDGEVSIHVPVRDPRAISAAILALLREPALRQRMGAAAHARAQTEFTAPRAVSVISGFFGVTFT